MKMMAGYHKKTADLFQREAARGVDADLKGFAARTLPVVREHHATARRIYNRVRSGGRPTNNNSNSNTNAGSR